MRFRIWILAFATAGVLHLPGTAIATVYRVDSEHTSVSFRVRHLFTQVKGRFDKFEGTIDFDPNKPKETKVIGTIDVNSINTNQAKRDDHLRSKDFFHVEKYPQITFNSVGVIEIDGSKNSGKMNGTLTIRGVEKPVVLEVAYLGEGKDPWGNRRAGFSARTTVNRKDFGLNWNKALETGGLLVGDEVRIELEIEGLVEE